MDCGKKYAAMVVTANNGYTAKNPYGLFGTPYDYSEWRSLAHRLATRARQHLDRLQAATKTPEQTARANELADRYNEIVDQVDNLPGLLTGTWNGVLIEQSISLAVNASVDAACTMELIDAELEAVGVTPPDEPKGRPARTSPLDMAGLGNLAILAAVGFVGWKLFREDS